MVEFTGGMNAYKFTPGGLSSIPGWRFYSNNGNSISKEEYLENKSMGCGNPIIYFYRDLDARLVYLLPGDGGPEEIE